MPVHPRAASMTVALPRVIGHRGAAAAAPENTLAGMRVAAAQGATWVEFDVRLSADGVPVLMHDDTLDRTTNGRGRVARASLRAIKALDAGAWHGPAFAGEPVPTLEETLAVLLELGLTPNVELKPNPGEAARTAEVALSLTERLWPEDRPAPLVSSFDVECLKAARRTAPALPRGFLWLELPRTWRARMAALECRTVHLWDRHITPRHAAAVKAAGYPLAVYSVDDPARARELLSWGVDAVFTDRPGALLRSFAEAAA
jgi:glycerophosphoryl diester phosphodiesterase